jgi:molybdopterin/thiamine biosynthesis adenylyltransferase
MEDHELLRYSRHILLDEIGIEGQQRLSNSHVLLIGAGGLGAACSPYLVAAGIGHLTIVDHDQVDLTNLQRQIIHNTQSVGQPKVTSAKNMLAQLNPGVKITAIEASADESRLARLIPTVDIVVDCTDNFKTRHLINRQCVAFKKPLVSGAAIQFDGQVSVFDQRNPLSACYACLFPEDETFEEAKCSTMGVFSPLVGVIGSIQAAQVLQMIAQFGEPLTGRLLIWDAKDTSMTQIKLQKNKACKVCQNN